MKELPSFSLPASNGEMYTHVDLSKGTVVLYVYPKDMTSGCTIEARDFSDMLPEFRKQGVKVFGLSRDTVESHEKFCRRDGLEFPLLSDTDTKLLHILGTWKEKTMYGKKYWGADRTTFVIRKGKIIKTWHQVKVPGHVAEVLDFVTSQK